MPDLSKGIPIQAAKAFLGLAEFASRLKSIPRTGWLDRGVPPLHVESVADHSLGVALLAWGCALQRQAEGAAIDPQRVLMLAILHDFAEAKTGDLPPYDPAAIPDEREPAARRAFLEMRHRRDPNRAAEKRAAEDAAVQQLLATLPDATRSELLNVWDDLRLGASSEAQFVKQVDRLETFLQSRRYLQSDSMLPMASFRQEVVESIDDPLLSAVRDAALADDTSDLPAVQE